MNGTATHVLALATTMLLHIHRAKVCSMMVYDDGGLNILLWCIMCRAFQMIIMIVVIFRIRSVRNLIFLLLYSQSISALPHHKPSIRCKDVLEEIQTRCVGITSTLQVGNNYPEIYYRMIICYCWPDYCNA